MTERPAAPLALKVTLAVAALTVLLGVAVVVTVTQGMRGTREHAAALAGQGVETQVRRRLVDTTRREARLAELNLLRAASATRVVA
ncbi:hypothetical protein, partial [Deinococcus pimensis]|uniref:hypothetical protein n=1 Tax=Deinococcus pimensis TaxID=309888 RepID=UPI0005EB2D39